MSDGLAVGCQERQLLLMEKNHSYTATSCLYLRNFQEQKQDKPASFSGAGSPCLSVVPKKQEGICLVLRV